MPTLDAVGLCRSCRWMRSVMNRRGSTFFRCARADTDARYPRYPALPVLECPGYEPGAAPDADPPADGTRGGGP